MTKLRASAVLFALALSEAACGADPPPELPPDEPFPIVLPDGGSIFLEYVHFDTELRAAFNLPAGVASAGRVIAYFMNRHTPEIARLPSPGFCNNLVATDGWPLHVGSPREDLDVGSLNIAGKNTAGTDVTITVPQRPMGADALGRPHDVYYQITSPAAADFLAPNSAYTVLFGGAGTVRTTTWSDVLFLPEHFTVQSPALEDDGPLRPGTDFPVRWVPAMSSNLPPRDDVIGIVWLADATGSPTHLCPVNHEAGQLTIAGSNISEYKSIAQARGRDPTKAILIRSALVHKLARLPNGDPENMRRIDMLAQYSWAQLVNVQ